MFMYKVTVYSIAFSAMVAVLFDVSTSNCFVVGFVSNPNLIASSSRNRGSCSSLLYVDSSSSASDAVTSPSKARSNRAERKRKERERKNRQRGASQSQNGQQSGEVYQLHSSAVSALTLSSTAQDVIRAIKRAQNLHDAHDLRNIERFLLEEVDEHYAYGYRGSLLSRLAVAAMHMNEYDLAAKALEVRKTYHFDTVLPMESSAIVRGLLRVHKINEALNVLDEELAVPLEPPSNQELAAAHKEKVKHRAQSIASFASRECYEDNAVQALLACQMLREVGPIVRAAGLNAEEVNMPWLRIVKGAAQYESHRRKGMTKAYDDSGSNLLYTVLDAMATFPSTNSDDVYESLSNALIRRTQFLTGAVDMTGLPKADRGEVAFIGKSNVGKSSLVNMITNRKSLAYTSKRPGKTQQFNYFAINDKVELEREVKYGDAVNGEKDDDSFYIVDLPGYGYAEVPDYQKAAWKDFMAEYLSQRKTLRVLLHLLDGRHGPGAEDAEIMAQVASTLPKSASYVVVLTKADKNVKGRAKRNSGKISSRVMQKVKETMKDNGVSSAPIVLTSSESKLGRDKIWRYLKLAAES